MEETDHLLGDSNHFSTPLIVTAEKKVSNRRHLGKLISGILLALSADAMFTMNNFIIQQYQVNISDEVLVRCTIQILLFSVYIHQKGEQLLPGKKIIKFLTVFQGFTGAVSMIMSYAAVRAIPVLDSLSIIYLSPVVTMFLAALLLKDSLNLIKIFSGIILVSGQLLICRPSFLFGEASYGGSAAEKLFLLGSALAFIACVSGSLNAVTVSRLSAEPISTAVLLTWVAISSLVLVSGYSLTFGNSIILSSSISTIQLRDWIIYFGLSLSGLSGFFCVTVSLKTIPPALVSSVRSLELLFAIFGSSIQYAQAPQLATCVGVFLLSMGVLILTLNESISEKLRLSNKDLTKYICKFTSSHHRNDYDQLP